MSTVNEHRESTPTADMKEELSILLIRTGLFFANCDGNYCEKEKMFVENFLKSLELNKILDKGSSEKYITDNIGSKFNIDSIIADTNHFVNRLEDDERKPFIEMMDEYIQGIIKADNVIDPNEARYYNTWKETIKS